ncbi:permease prefix domain 1-containing protein [Salimicrobium sp. PL1-032A]|uniref:permease prefix domain 1-containing protein n=1 Tax=Salimicrobium sp. PL1-032A TaxID=3095364 RepID=UPI003261BA06
MKKLEKHVEQILDHMQSPEEERQDIREELLSHLQDSYTYHKNQGNSGEEAERKALSEFGDPDLIGKGMQESMYPFQRRLLYIIGGATILYGAVFFLFMLVMNGEEFPVWLSIQFLVGSAVVMAGINISSLGRNHWLLNTIVMLSAIWNGFNITIVVYTVGAFVFGFLSILIILTALIFMVRNSYLSSGVAEMSKQERFARKVSYTVNILFGVMIAGAALFIIFGFMVFGGFSWILLVPAGAIVAWLVFFRFQMKWISKSPISAMIGGVFFLMVIVGGPFLIMYVM